MHPLLVWYAHLLDVCEEWAWEGFNCCILYYSCADVINYDCVFTCEADILKTNDEVVKVIALYNEVINKADVVSLLIDDNGE